MVCGELKYFLINILLIRKWMKKMNLMFREYINKCFIL